MPKRVVVWDLDETLILFHSLINESYARANPCCPCVEAHAYGEQWQDAILDLSDEHFFYRELEGLNFFHISDLDPYDDGVDLDKHDFASDAPETVYREPSAGVAHRIRRCCALYQQGLGKMRSEDELQQCAQLYQDTDDIVQGWLSHARQLLLSLQTPWPADRSPGCTGPVGCSRALRAEQEILQETGLQRQGKPEQDGSANDGADQDDEIVQILVTLGELVPTFAKLLLFRLDGFFAPENVYSAREAGKCHAFSILEKRFGHDARYVVIGDGPQEEEAAAQRMWPFMRINMREMVPPSGSDSCVHRGNGYLLCKKLDAAGSLGRTLTSIGPKEILELLNHNICDDGDRKHF